MDDLKSSSMRPNDPSSLPPPPGYFTILHNYPLMSAFFGFFVAQSMKFLTTRYTCKDELRYKDKKWDIKQLIASGGMPSSHSSTVTALAVAVGFQEGFADSVFAVAMILACVVMYDAVGIRLHAGKQAEVLNQIVYELPSEHPLAEARPLRELLGHTPYQVFAGSVLGILIAVTGHLIRLTTSR